MRRIHQKRSMDRSLSGNQRPMTAMDARLPPEHDHDPEQQAEQAAGVRPIIRQEQAGTNARPARAVRPFSPASPAVMLRRSMSSLEALLKEAASQADWTHSVAHRCAWCQKVQTPDGAYTARALEATVIATDGMCPTCFAEALAAVQRRPRRVSQLAAAA
jgi:hypothetical protein